MHSCAWCDALFISLLVLSLQTKAYLALAAICVIWGTTYAGIKVAVHNFPPFMLVGIRQTAAGLILLALAWMTGKAVRISPRYLLIQALTGLATITGGNGFITWGLQYVSTGLSSVIGALAPVLIALISLFWKGKGEKMHPLTLIGVLTGFAGMMLVFGNGWADFFNPNYRWGIAGCFASCFSWSLGTVMAKRYNDYAIAPIFNAGLQITAGGIGGFLLSLLFDPPNALHLTQEGVLAMAYLVLIGSSLAFTLYMFILKHLSATMASIYTYINPMVAILIGWWWLGEHFTVWELIGVAITISGVWLVNQGERRGAQ